MWFWADNLPALQPRLQRRYLGDLQLQMQLGLGSHIKTAWLLAGQAAPGHGRQTERMPLSARPGRTA